MFGLLPSPWLLLGTVLGLVLAAGGGFWEGQKVASARFQLEISQMQLAGQVQVEKTRQAMLEQAQAAGAALEQKKEQTRVVYRDIVKQVDQVVDRPVYRGECFDPDGLQLANAAAGRATSAGGSADKPGKSLSPAGSAD